VQALSELEWPPSIDHSVVALFLLVCDIACNPAEGLPMALRTPSTFISDVVPGVRFIFLCRAIALVIALRGWRGCRSLRMGMSASTTPGPLFSVNRVANFTTGTSTLYSAARARAS
jgi:hypothetical protein